MKTKIVGICNVTPDSFSDGGLYIDPEKAIDHVRKMFDQGADLVDIGAESTRPGSERLDPVDEFMRLKPVVAKLAELGLLDRISVDTFHPFTADRVQRMGVRIINDVTGFTNGEMIQAIERGTTAIVCHLPYGDIGMAHQNPDCDDIHQVVEDLTITSELMEEDFGVCRQIADPGIGFGKTKRLNLELLGFPKYFALQPVMIGYSRKRFLGDHRMDPNRNVEAGLIAMEAGAAYLRVHDVAEHVEARDKLQGVGYADID